MDKDSEIFEKFKEILRNRESNTYVNLYNSDRNVDRQNCNIKTCVSARDILASVDNEIKAIQGADCINSGQKTSKNIKMDRKINFCLEGDPPTFLPVNMLPQYEPQPSKATSSTNKFETQCVSDTQLVNLIQDAEAIDAHRGMTQEFESSFCDVTENDNNLKQYNQRNVKARGSDSANIENDNIIKQDNHRNINPIESRHVEIEDFRNAYSETKNYLYPENDFNMDAKETNNLNSESKRTNIPENMNRMNNGESDESDCEILEDNADTSCGVNRHKNSENIDENEVILDSDSVIISNEPLDLENISQNYEVFSIPVTIETGENSNDFENNEYEENPENIDENRLDEQLPGNDAFDDHLVQNREERTSIVDISLKEPVTNNAITNIDILETEFTVNANIAETYTTNNKDITMDQSANNKGVFQDIKNPLSPTFEVKVDHKIKKFQNSPENLVVDLETFEAFEKFALKAIKNRSDVKTVNFLIDSQILGKELQIQTDSEPVLNEPEIQNIEIIDGADSTNKKEENLCISEGKAGKVIQDAMKDDILFSSDEEEELLLNKLEIPTSGQDLPLTCALETSFYDQPDILDKTMYVGFQTASNKSIQICTDSFHKAQSVYDNIEKQISGQEPSLIKLVENYDAESNVSPNICDNDNTSIEKTSFLEENKNNNCDKDDNVTVEDQPTNTDYLSQILPAKSRNKIKTTLGFRTASNKNIKLTDFALGKAKKVFEGVAVFESETNIKNRIENIRNKITNTIINDLDANLQSSSEVNFVDGQLDTETKFEESNDIVSPDEATSSCKESEEIVFADFNLDDISLLKDNVFDDCDFNEKVDMNEMPENSKKNSTEKVMKNVDLAMGFRTASNKCIQISDEALAKTKNIFRDVESEALPNKQNSKVLKNFLSDTDFKNENLNNKSNYSFFGFKTASNKSIKISEKALVVTKNIFNDVNLAEISKTTITNPVIDAKKINNGFDGDTNALTSFKTGSDKRILVSKETLHKTENVFQDIYTDFSGEPNIDVENRNQAKFEVKLAVSVQNKLDTNTSANIGDLKDAVPSGFKTASNKNIEISSEAVCKTKKIFNDLIFGENFDSVGGEGKSGQVIVGFQTASSKPFLISEAELAISGELFKDLNKNCERPGNMMIQTSRKNEEEKSHKRKKPIGDGKIFQTNIMSNDNDFKISEKALEKSRQIFQDLDNQMHIPRLTGNSSPKFEGFKTASDKKVFISEKALATSRKLFQDLDNEIPIPDPLDNNNFKFKDFKTASHKEVHVSEKSIAKSRKSFQYVENENCTDDKFVRKSPHSRDTLFLGFKTASSKDVKISKQALAKSKKLFQDLENEMRMPDPPDITRIPKTIDKITTKYQGFQTASNKQVKISEKSLARSQKLYQDLDDMMTPVKLEVCGLKCKGFQTASQQKVTISPRALSRSRKILDALCTNENKEDETLKHVIGFQTASNKEVKISDAALAKSRKLFEDVIIELDSNDTQASNTQSKCSFQTTEYVARNYETNNFDKHRDSCYVQGSKPANKKRVKLSKPPLSISKNEYSDLEQKAIVNVEKIATDSDTADVNLENIVNTQLLNQFEESMHTEDFKETTPVKSKRSGSPILSCPKPKRRKFEIPYSQKVKVQTDTTLKDTNFEKGSIKIDLANKTDEKSISSLNFDVHYKKIKTITLNDIVKLEKDSTGPKPEMDTYISRFNFNNLLNFEFFGKRNKLNDSKLSVEDIKKLFLYSVNKKLIPDGWIENHIKLIIWKLLSYELKFPKTMSLICTAKNVIDQLKYRYDKELYSAERPALRKIMEKDDIASKTLVLCVADIIQEEFGNDGSRHQSTELLLTDGWYTIRASTDPLLARMVVAGRIAVGTKLVTSGAELLGCEQGVAPWEDTSAIRLKISGNSTRRARWDARLGYLGNRGGSYGNACVPANLGRVSAEGGKVARVRVLVTRVYPALYVEKFEDGSTVTRSERLEMHHQMRYEAERQALLEKLYEEVEKELSDQDSQDSDGAVESSAKRRCLETGSQIAKVMRKSKDPNEFRSNLTESQRNLLQAHTLKQREKYLQAVQEKIQEKLSKSGVNVNRNVVTLLKVRVVGIEDKRDVVVTRGMLSIWKPNDELMEVIKEGAWIEIMNVLPTTIRNSEIQLSAGRQSVFLKSKFKESERIKPFTISLNRTCYSIKELTKNPAMTTDYNEIDTIGIIFLIDPPIKTFDSNKFQFQNVYLADADKSMISVNFWGGLKKYGVENILETAQIISCSNLQKRAGNTRKSIPQYRATEFSYFTKTPRCENARKLIDDLQKKMLHVDKDKFCEDCVNLKNNFAVIKSYGNSDVSPYRFQDVNVSKNKIFLDSPLARKNDDNFNLTGLDFESTFKQSDTQEMSPKLLLRKRQINEKIAKLRMYGDPPPLSPIQILNKSANATKAFKSPLIPKSSDTNAEKMVADKKNSVATAEQSVTSVNNKLSENKIENKNEPNKVMDEEVQCSPVLNKTYVKKNMNPMRLNFSKSDAINENDISDVIDQFGEDFDGSPPLSLD